MAEAWVPERVVEPELARTLIRAQCPGIAAVRVEPFGAGFDNTAFLVDETWVFRFPRREIVVPFLETESRVLPALASRLPLEIPEPRWLGRPSDAFPWPFAGYRKLEGTTACIAHPNDAERKACAPLLGRFLAALHTTQPTQAMALPGDVIGRMDVAKRRRMGRESLADLEQAGLVDAGRARRLAGRLDACPEVREYAPRVVVHGDLYARHLLMDGSHHLRGVIDWGDAHRGHAALDLSIAPMFLPASALPAFCEAYGPIDDATWSLAAFRAIWHATLVARFAAKTAEADLLRESLESLARLDAL